MQWRGIVITLAVIVESIYFVIVFWTDDISLEAAAQLPQNQKTIQLWSYCLVLYNDRNRCMDYIAPLTRPTTTYASMILAAVSISS